MIVPLHNHSMYSALDGFSTPEEIADRCLEIEAPACGITDHGVVSGHLHANKALRKAGVKPIFGCELYHGVDSAFKPQGRDQAHLVALAKNDVGLRNLWCLTNVTAQEDHFHHVGRVFWDDLERFKEGLIVTSACIQGLVSQGLHNDDFEALNRYLEIFKDNFYIELHTYEAEDQADINRTLMVIAQERGIPLVYATDAHFAHPWQYPYHDLYIAAQTRDTIFTPPEERSQHHPEGSLFIQDEDTVRERLSYLPKPVVDEAIQNTVAIAETVSADLPEVKRHLPVFVPSECPWLKKEKMIQTPETLFIDLVVDGIRERYGQDAPDEVWERALYEMEQLLKDKIHHYFLWGWDEVQFVRSENIPMGPGRGSSAGSIVAYALGITDVDPLKYGLIFERFWNPGRAKGFPDIDSDFSRRGRAKVIQYLKDRLGEDRVAAIGTTGFMKPKSTIDKLKTTCGITMKEAEELKAIVGKTTKIDILGHEQIGWNPEYEPGKVYYVKDDVGDEIDEWIKADASRRDLRQIFVDFCEICCSRVQQYGIHASGIVIGDQPLAGELPAYRRGGKAGVPATMFPMNDVDERQWVKLDVLGLRTLDVLDYWCEFQGYDMTHWQQIDWDEYQWIWEMLPMGFTAGIFQVEDGYGRQLCKRIEPKSIDDMAAINALNRPGPIQAGTADEYINRRNGVVPVTYIHPGVEELMGDNWGPTYGLVVYQEQLIEFFNRVGYTLSESDAVRKILGKKRPEQLNAIRDGLGEWEGRGYFELTDQYIPREIAEALWEDFKGFADYSFNKPHAVCYGLIGARTLYAKATAPAAFYAAVLKSFESSDPKREAIIPELIDECRRLDIPVGAPDIRYSMQDPFPDGETLRFGFKDIKGVGVSGDYIVELRESGIDITTPDAFRAGLDELSAQFKALPIEERRGRRSPKQLLGAGKVDALEKAGCWADICGDLTLTERQKREQEYLGVIITDNTKEVLENNAERITQCDEYSEVTTPWERKADETIDYITYEVAGTVSHLQEKRTRAGNKPFGIATLEHQGEQLEVLIPSSSWRSFKRLFKLRTVGIFTVRQQPPNEYGESYLYVNGKQLR